MISFVGEFNMSDDSGLTKREFLQTAGTLPALKLMLGSAAAAAPETGASKFTPVPLAEYFNAAPRDLGSKPEARGLSAGGREDGLLRMPAGSQTFRGIPFLLGPEGVGNKSWVVLSRSQKPWATAEVEIAAAGKASYLCLTGFCDWDPLESPAPGDSSLERVGQQLAELAFLFEDGTRHAAPIRRRFETNSPSYRWGHLSFASVPHRQNLPRSLSDPLRDARHWGDLQMGLWEGAYGGNPAVDNPATLWLAAVENPSPDRTIKGVRFEARSDDLLMLCGLTLFHGRQNPLRYDRLALYRITPPVKGGTPGGNRRWSVSVDLGVVARTWQAGEFDAASWLDSPTKGLPERTGPAAADAPLYAEVSASPDATLTLTNSETGEKYDLPLAGADAPSSSVSVRVLEREKTWLHGTILDSGTKRPTPVRLAFRSKEGRYIPPYGHRTEINGGWFQDYGADLRWSDSSFAYVDGTFQVELPAGEVYVELSKGFEYEPVRRKLDIAAGQRELTLEIGRFADLRSKNWVSADTHVHFLSPSTAVLEAQAEGLNLINLLAAQWGDLFTNVGDLSYGPLTSKDGEAMVHVGTENRQHILGHLGLLGGHGQPVFPMSASGPHESYFGDPLWTTLSDWADACRKREGLVVAVHFPYPTAELAAAIEGKRIDAVELRPTGMTEHFNNLYFQEWYRYLNCGYRLPIAGGTDKMSASVPAGGYRTYAHLGQDEFTFANWAKAVRAGKTFLSSGPLLQFSADGQAPGAEIRTSGPASIEVIASADSSTPIHRMDIVWNGTVVASRESGAGARNITLKETIRTNGTGWLAARCASKTVAGGIRIAAHTSPVYVVAPGQELFSRDMAVYMLTLIEGAELWASTLATRPDAERFEKVLGVFRDARASLHQRLHKHGIRH